MISPTLLVVLSGATIALLLGPVTGLQFPAPRETDNALTFPIGWSPKPTPAPNANAVHGGGGRASPHELFRRTMGANTCGWIDGVESMAFTCVGEGYCAHNSASAVGCCTGDISTCTVPVACLDSTVANGCSDAGPNTICCIYSQYPSCVTYFWDVPDEGASMFQCNVSPAKILMETTFTSGAASTSSIEPPAPTTTTPAPASTTATPSSSTPQVTKSISIPVISPTPTNPNPTTPATPTTPSTSAPPATSSAAAASSGGSSTPIGAIVGGVVGGLAIIAGIVIAILLYLRSSRRNSSNTGAAGLSNQPPGQMQQPGYDPRYPPPAGGMGPQMQQPSYPPNSGGVFYNSTAPTGASAGAADDSKAYPVVQQSPPTTEYGSYPLQQNQQMQQQQPQHGGYGHDPNVMQSLDLSKTQGWQSPTPQQQQHADAQELPVYMQTANSGISPVGGVSEVSGYSYTLSRDGTAELGGR